MIINVNPLRPEKDGIRRAATAIRAGGLVAFPTETVYGLGADALNDAACRKIFLAKGRPADNPLIVHVSSVGMAEKLAYIPVALLPIIKRVWPSPLTFIVKKRTRLPDSVTASLDTVAIRMPAHPIALALIKEADTPIAAPSANLSGKPSPTDAKTVVKDLKKSVDVILDGGPTFFGIESTVIDLRDFTLLRPGPFTPEEIEKTFGVKPRIPTAAAADETDKPASPGMKYRHYAPDTKLVLFTGRIGDLIDTFSTIEKPVCLLASKETCTSIKNTNVKKIILGSRNDGYEVAKNLFTALRSIDDLGVDLAVAEAFQENGIWLAVMNRLRKACGNVELSSKEDLLELFFTKRL